ncbi:ankyrin repeat protein [Leptospira meyeri]|uniref:Ankyrin repeat protein n=2 Tax=Leptospira meyeri TaxID=29508 RepID=A0A4R8MYW3_LEPME|nr:ankyrin repeat domain-containing protein [Leptospira meyeri]TDY72166.1 ankyrin repeat protein [Leptospira meyeri]
MIAASGGRAIHEAAFLGDAKQIKLLIQFKANVNVKNNAGMTPLHIASLHGYTDCVKILLDAGAFPNERDKKYKHPIHYAVSNNSGNINVLNLLLE